MQLTIQHRGNLSFEASTRGHRVVTDQPADNGGTDSGMTPPELYLAALGTCVGHYAVAFMNARHLSTEGLSVSVTADKLLKPARLGAFRVSVTAPSVEPDQEAGLYKAVHACLIHNTMAEPQQVDITLQCGVGQAVGS